MLRGMTAQQFWEWRAYAALEPFGDERADWQIASIVCMLANINRDATRRPQPYKVDEFLLKFGSVKPPQQTWQESKLMAKLWVSAYNEIAGQ